MMKILLLSLFLLFSLHADEALSELFKQLETVSKEDKFKVVNRIKKHVIALKQQERIDAIKLLKAKKEAEAKTTLPKKSTNEVLSSASSVEEEHHMENHEHNMANMNAPQMASHMEQMQNMQSMSKMPLMQEIKDKKQRGTMGTPPANMPNGMRGNR